MTTHPKIDFVSDVSCPWRVIGLNGLEERLARAAGTIDAETVFRSFQPPETFERALRGIAAEMAARAGCLVVDDA